MPNRHLDINKALKVPHNSKRRTVYSGVCIKCKVIFYTFSHSTSIAGYCNATCARDKGPHIGDKGYIIHANKYIHRLVVEKFLRRKLTTKEHVHHINHNKQDNRIRNLVIVTRSENTKLQGKLVSKAFSLLPQEILEQLTMEELYGS